VVDHLRHCDGLEAEIARFAEVLGRSDTGRPVASCPGWSVLDLAGHLGGVHRWAEYLVAHRAPRRIPPAELPADRGPVDPGWIRSGGDRLLATLRRTDPDLPMWAWGPDQHVRWWSRRQHHETVIHRIDLELAVGLPPRLDDRVAADGIDEFLGNLPAAAVFSPRIDQLGDTAGRLAFADRRTGRRWVVESGPSGAGLVHGDRSADGELTADGLDLLLALYRRRPIGETEHVVEGDDALLRWWLEHSALE
jgi:uncharacterized protein (TIGR03083 family)